MKKMSYVVCLLLLIPCLSYGKLSANSKAKKYYIYSYDDSTVYIKDGNKKYKIQRSDFKKKKIKINEWVYIHEDGLKKYAKLIK